MLVLQEMKAPGEQPLPGQHSLELEDMAWEHLTLLDTEQLRYLCKLTSLMVAAQVHATSVQEEAAFVVDLARVTSPFAPPPPPPPSPHKFCAELLILHHQQSLFWDGMRWDACLHLRRLMDTCVAVRMNPIALLGKLKKVQSFGAGKIMRSACAPQGVLSASHSKSKHH